MKIALLSSDTDTSAGWGNITHELCSTLCQREDVVFDLYLPRNAGIDNEPPYVKSIHQALPSWIGTFRHGWYRAIPFIWPRIAVDKPGLIHSLVEFPFAILARGLAKRLGIPYGVSTQGTYAVVPFSHRPDRWLYKRALVDAEFITTPSSFTAEAMRRASGLEKPVHIIHNAVNFSRFQHPVDLGAVRKRFGLTDDTRFVLGIGGLKQRKGFDVLVRAFEIVAGQMPNVHLIIAGEGPLRSQLEKLACTLGLAAKVHLVGNVLGDDLVGLYQLCDVYSHLPVNTRWNFEGFGIVYLEAASCGKPVVASRSGGVTDAVLDGETGLLVDEEDPAQAARAILRLLQDQSLASYLGSNGREYARRHQWSWYAGELVRLYDLALGKNDIRQT